MVVLGARECVPLELADLRSTLIRLEETIIFAIIERAQYGHNTEMYSHTSDVSMGMKHQHQREISYVEFVFEETEKLHANLMRYSNPEEHPFFPQVVRTAAVTVQTKTGDKPPIIPTNINVNDRIRKLYETTIIPKLCENVDDGQYGSSALADIAVLQALSRRIHYGKFVAEAKYQAETELYRQMILAGDRYGLLAALTKPEVEKHLLERVELKTRTYGKDPQNAFGGEAGGIKVEPTLVSDIYLDFIIPLTKEVEVEYLLQRLDQGTVAYYSLESDTRCTGDYASLRLVPMASIEHVIEAVASGEADIGSIPIECHSGGIQRATELGLLKANLRIISCVQVNTGSSEQTRYFLIRKHTAQRTTACTTTEHEQTVIILGIKRQGAGSLSDILNILGEHQINLTVIESLPAAATGHMACDAAPLDVFYVEAGGHHENGAFASAIERLREARVLVRVLGTYVRPH